jgi:hypothetical protein
MIDPTHQRRRYRRGEPNSLPEPLPEVPGATWGPCMKALPSDRHRAFVLGLYQVPPGYGAHVRAARLAGFGSSTSSPASMVSIASRLAHDENILRAIFEEDQRRIRSTAPRAIRALQHLVETPDHRDHCRALGMVLDRVHPAQTNHVVDVNHHVTIDHNLEAVEQLRALKAVGVPREKLVEVFGYSGISRYEEMLEEADRKSGKLIEGTVSEAVEP